MFVDSYTRLPASFYTSVPPTHVAAPRLIKFNGELADELGLGLDTTPPPMLAELFSGNRLLAGSHPIAMVYAGHQFGQFVPQLGDGRAILLGEVIDRYGKRRDIQLKGSGRTPYSRSGDGRAALGPVLREYLVSEAMHSLHLPTTRALAAVATGEPVFREGQLPGAIFTRVAASHVRVGTFQYFAARGDAVSVRQLADYVIDRHYPDARLADNPYLELLRRVVGAQTRLVAGWMSIGFIHGVMNTDNTSIAGETIDFGPCAFLDEYDPATVFSSIDHRGRYAFGNQPAAAQWNVARFAETILGLIDPDGERSVQLATEAVTEFMPQYSAEYHRLYRRKIGLSTEEAGDAALIGHLLELMQSGAADFTLTFRALAACAGAAGHAACCPDDGVPPAIRE
ncbi:MAG: YdiU family protein, partial [Pseudomonadota bacterium]|nr:YdiU family protein [Pseudomonadota bacterium]